MICFSSGRIVVSVLVFVVVNSVFWVFSRCFDLIKVLLLVRLRLVILGVGLGFVFIVICVVCVLFSVCKEVVIRMIVCSMSDVLVRISCYLLLCVCVR